HAARSDLEGETDRRGTEGGGAVVDRLEWRVVLRVVVLAPLALILVVRMPDAPAQAMTVGEANAKFVDHTRISFSPGHGTQVSYMRADGTVFLWYPGNRVVVRGRWLI